MECVLLYITSQVDHEWSIRWIRSYLYAGLYRNPFLREPTKICMLFWFISYKYVMMKLTSLQAQSHGSSSSLTFPLGKPQDALVKNDCTNNTCDKSSFNIIAPYVGTDCLYSLQLSKILAKLDLCFWRNGICWKAKTIEYKSKGSCDTNLNTWNMCAANSFMPQG